ncbi:hypothetical protein Btru_077699 [Bulinus truncatus]|nr:hypothetical protein Btru_077699 [Bulinus truncatus]
MLTIGNMLFPFVIKSLLSEGTAKSLSQSANTSLSVSPTMFNSMTSSLDKISLAENDHLWEGLAGLLDHVIKTQNSGDFPNLKNTGVFVVFYDPDLRWSVEYIQRSVISTGIDAVFLLYTVPDSYQDSLALYRLDLAWDIVSVFILTDSRDFLLRSLRHVASKSRYRWTALKHTAEWIIVSRSVTADSINVSLTPDFLTVISAPDSDKWTIAQKARNSPFNIVIELDPVCVTVNFNGRHIVHATDIDVFSECALASKAIQIKKSLRKNGQLFLKGQKSPMDGLHIMVPMFLTQEQIDNFDAETLPALDTLVLSLLKLLAEDLGFMYNMTTVSDGKYYGSVTSTGATGITGQLARREIAMSMFPMAMIDNRLGLVDFVHYPTILESNKIIYRLPSGGDDLDMTFIEIVSPSFAVFLLGPLVCIGLAGAVVHVTTRSCSVLGPLLVTPQDLRLLRHFPKHFCFDTDENLVNHSGRILKASWGVFWIILGSAYSAYLTSTLSVRNKDLTITSLEDLVETPAYNFGINGRMSGLLTILENWPRDDAISKTWELLQKQLMDDPMITSDNASYHMRKMLNENYVFITTIPISGVDMKDFQAAHEDVRIYDLKEFPDLNLDFIGLPKNVFYKEHLHKSLLKLEQSFIKEHLRESFLHTQTRSNNQQVNEQQPITISKLQLILYVVAGGAVVALMVLMGEVVLVRFQREPEIKLIPPDSNWTLM